MAAALGIADSVAFETGFLPNHMSFERLSECDVVALAHRPSREASSAALRGAMAAGMPVAVTPVALFDEAEDAVFRFGGVEAEAIARGLDRLLTDAVLRARLQTAAQNWMKARRWESVARQVGGMAAGLVRTARLRPNA
jgi:glycosyltransferase involved in cell wall biosynthesis